MKKRKIIKCAILCAMVSIVLLTAIMPTFAWTQSNDTANVDNCAFTFNGDGQLLSSYYNNDFYMSTNGDLTIFISPILIVRQKVNGVYQNYTFNSNVEGYAVYFNADDNAQTMLIKIKDIYANQWFTYNALTTNVYAIASDTDYPILYNSNIESICSSSDYKLPFWSLFKIADRQMYVVSSRYKDDITKGAYQHGYNEGLAYGIENGYTSGYTEGYNVGQTDGITTQSTFKSFISAIVTAPSHFISTIFDFNIFGYNVANIVRALFTLLIIGVVTVIILKIVF